ncbi:MAG: hypothetical protein Q4B68_05565 [Bacteroidales bacterium]|nr:hypothetical protein [Bacteroidales bacterium]
MKKLLLLAAAAVALSANAQTLTQTWKVDIPSTLPWADCRQGVGMDGKIYINNKSDQKVYVVTANGVAEATLPGGANCGIGLDQAGNIFVSDAAFPNSWAADAPIIKVYNPATPNEVTTLSITEDIAGMGRADFVGSAKGDLTGEGELLLVGGTSTGISKLVVVDGETSADDSYVASIEGVTFGNLVVVRPFMDGEEEKYLYQARNAAPAIIFADGDNFAVEKTMAWEEKGACNGSDIFVLGGKKYVVYPTLPNYTDGVAIACLDDEAVDGTLPAVAKVAPELSANPNSCQANWLNAEVVSENEAIIYQYVPGAYAKAFSFTVGAPTGINDVNAANDVKVRKVVENGQVYIINGDAKYNVMGAQVK